ncbi:relaxase/mobilization nuclease domain-containing protein [Maribacter sp. ACAM166]|uniref:relaxase/mobilization nuclease domain-containing protein n=1 Tax=Maribacter sp. ACAM166 TaxID=2508996 RepID=UPI0010FD4906|nr:relaxase/mobilization nuclease domain-containing protein [Maribacter sp. ACAM166]TLP71187.1 mobilization protein [Maribacter sp. ACAM166]
MIGKGKAVAHTGVSIAYGWDKEKDAEIVINHHLAGDNAQEVTEEFKMVQEMNKRCHNNTLSFILSPTVEDGKKLNKEKLREMTERFLKEMQLKERQVIAFVHRDKAHTHVHLYVNRIGFDGKAYNDSFIGKRSQLAAERVAKEMGITTVNEVQMEKQLQSVVIRNEIRRIHERTLSNEKLKTLDAYIKAMKAQKVAVVPSINKANRLQGFRFDYKGQSFKGSEVHRSMSGGRLLSGLSTDMNIQKRLEKVPSVNISGKALELSSNMASALAKKVIKQVIKKVIDTGIGF